MAIPREVVIYGIIFRNEPRVTKLTFTMLILSCHHTTDCQFRATSFCHWPLQGPPPCYLARVSIGNLEFPEFFLQNFGLNAQYLCTNILLFKWSDGTVKGFTIKVSLISVWLKLYLVATLSCFCKSRFCCCNDSNLCWFLSNLVSIHCISGPLRTSIRWQSDLVYTAPLCTVVSKSSPPVFRMALLYASCSSWDKIFGSSASASKQDVLIVSLGKMKSGISNLS